MSDLSTTVSLIGASTLVYDDSRQLLYISNEAGEIFRWSPYSHSFLSPIITGRLVVGMDISPDGQYLIAGGYYSEEIHLDTNTVDNVQTIYSGIRTHVAIAADSTQFVTDQDLNAGESDRYVLIADSNSSAGYLQLYDSIAGRIIATGYSNTTNSPRADVSDAAGLVYEAGKIYDTNLHLTDDLAGVPGDIISAHFNVGGHQLFLLDRSTDKILVFDTNSWRQEGSFGLSSSFYYYPAPYDAYDAVMTMSKDGRFLFIGQGDGGGNGGYGFEVVDLAARLSINATGSSGDDKLFGAIGADTLSGGGGNDILDGGAGNDSLDGGPGSDTASYASSSAGVSVGLLVSGPQDTVGAGVDTLASIENLIGSNFNDTLSGDGSPNVIEGGAGDDSLDGGGGGDTVSYASAGSGVTVSLSLQGGAQNTGGAGTDILSNFENLTGSAFNDVLAGDAGDNMLQGGGGVDTASYASVDSGVTVTLAVLGAQNTGGAGTDTLISIENLVGSAFDDVLTGDDGANVLEGGAGNDTLDGGAGTDTASYASATSGVMVSLAASGAQATGGAGTDTLISIENLVGSAFNDILTAASTGSSLQGLGGNDVLNSGASNDTLDGGTGTDTASYASATSGVTVSLAVSGAQATGGAGTDTLISIENLVGSAFNDILTAASIGSSLQGLGGNDVLIGDAGNDTLDGGAGTDTASYAAASAGVTVSLLLSGAQNTVGAGTDTLISIENLIGSGFNDTLTAAGSGSSLQGSGGDDTLIGGAGNDALNGGAGTDTASYASATSGVTVNLANAAAQNTGGAGTDTLTAIENLIGSGFSDTLTAASTGSSLQGMAGDDVLVGGAGNDTLDGGGGTDTASYASASAGVTVSLAISGAQNTIGAGTDTLTAIENLTGSGFNDTLTGSTTANVISGGAGNDSIKGGAGDDTLDGGDGTDTAVFSGNRASYTITTVGGVTTVAGPDGTDTLTHIEKLQFADVTISLAGQTIVGTSGDDVLTGGTGNDTITGLDGNDILDGGAGNDTLDGGNGTDTASYGSATAGVTVSLAISGAQNTIGDGTDTLTSIENLTGSAFNDTLTGDANANVLSGGAGNDKLNGGGGIDTASYASATAGVTVNLANLAAQNTVGAGTDTLSSIENLTGSNFNDTLTGDGNTNVLTGGLGNDVLNGGAGIDTASYATATSGVSVSLKIAGAQNTLGAGTDTLTAIENLIGSNFADALTASNTGSSLQGLNGDDVLFGGAGNDSLDGGLGNDTVSYALATAGVTVSLATTSAQNTIGAGTDTLTSFENLLGSNFNDTLTAAGVGSAINGGAGDDILNGGVGNDTLEGGVGNDTLTGGGGSDTAAYTLATSGVTVSLMLAGAQNTVGAGTDTLTGIANLTGSNFNDHLTGDNNANVLNGGNGNDVLTGNNGNDTLNGGAGNDQMNGGNGNDALIGGSGNDTINGAAGNDVITGNDGADTLTGAAGADTFVFAALTDSLNATPDLITDFAAGDHIDLSAIDADTGTVGDQAFHLGGGGGHAGDIVVTYDAGNNRTVLQLYVDNNASVDATIWLTGNHSGIAAGDFVL